MQENPAVLIPKIDPTEADANPVDDLVVKPRKNKKIWVFVIAGLVLFLLLAHLVPALVFYNKIKSVYKNIPQDFSLDSIQNTDDIKNAVDLFNGLSSDIKSSYKWIAWMKHTTPIVGKYVDDLGHGLEATENILGASTIALEALDPYLAELGFKEGDGEDSAEKTTQERIDFVVNAIPALMPKYDEIVDKLNQAEKNLMQINPNDYPEEFRGIEVRSKLRKIIEQFEYAKKYVSSSKPLLEATPDLLGINGERKYFVLFQNDKELRPTGGFLTAYSIMDVVDAKFEPVISDDIYNLDGKYKPVIPAPQPIVDLIKGPYILSKNIRLRDMNYSPDFKLSMDMFTKEASTAGMRDIDGIIAVDTHLLVNILDVLGEIGVPGFGNYSTKNDPRCNCPQVVYELESFADIEGPIIWDPLTGEIILRPPNSDNRKKIIGPLMNSILANALGQPKEKLPDLINAVFKSMTEKHVMFYLFDENEQKAVEDFGVAGRILDYGGDYLHISDSNLGGRKSNLYVTQEVEQIFEVNKSGVIEKTVTITYKNPEKHDGWLNSVLPNWVRIYVPEGSQLIEATGLEKQYDQVEELGKSVFSGYFRLRPEGVAKVTFKYSLPFKKAGNEIKTLIQKQPGTSAPLYIVSSQKDEQEFLLNTDKEIKIKI